MYCGRNEYNFKKLYKMFFLINFCVLALYTIKYF